MPEIFAMKAYALDKFKTDSLLMQISNTVYVVCILNPVISYKSLILWPLTTKSVAHIIGDSWLLLT